MMRFLVAGTAFGFILSRVGATSYDTISGMFRLTDLHIAGVIGIAALVAGLGLRWVARLGGGTPTPKPMKPGLLVGGLVFGIGWALTGTCPGTGLAQLGEGRVMALFTVFGIFAGTALHRAVGAKVEGLIARATPWGEKHEVIAAQPPSTPPSQDQRLAG